MDVKQDLLDSFRLYRSTSGNLENYIRRQAMKDEVNNEAKTYIVIDCVTGEIAAYFALRASMYGCYSSVLQLLPPKITQILETSPVVEISNFAVNDDYKAAHPDKLKLTGSLGSMVFFDFIIPIVQKAKEFIGIWGLCIYALPMDRLIHFYAGLGFKRLERKFERQMNRHMKATYDQGCIFMYQKI